MGDFFKTYGKSIFANTIFRGITIAKETCRATDYGVLIFQKFKRYNKGDTIVAKETCPSV